MTNNSDLKRTEIVFGLVGAIGTEFKDVTDALESELQRVGYNIEYIKFSLLIEEYANVLEKEGISTGYKEKYKDKADKIESLMSTGNKICEHYDNSETIAILAIDEIIEKRKGKQQKERNTAYILKSLKRPEEVYALRQIYGVGFYLVGIYSSREKRKQALASEIAHSNNVTDKEKYYSDVEKLILRDKNEQHDFGQDVSSTFCLSDFFISIEKRADINDKIRRFVELVFSNPFHTPTKDEYAMFFAHAGALRSGALARQVGTVITAQSGEILSVGSNDVPCFGGGLYWVDSKKDERDIVLREDSNTMHINLIIEGIANVLEESQMVVGSKEKIVEKIKSESYLKNLTEFGRTVHAEMDAIIQASRLGIPVKGGILYTTLFPCQNCTKHIIAAGIKKVIYIEPYPKSLAQDLHGDSVVIEEEALDRVVLLPFEGVGPRLFQDLFSLISSTGIRTERKEKHSGKVRDWVPQIARPRLPLSPTSYLDEEKARIEKVLFDV